MLLGKSNFFKGPNSSMRFTRRQPMKTMLPIVLLMDWAQDHLGMDPTIRNRVQMDILQKARTEGIVLVFTKLPS